MIYLYPGAAIYEKKKKNASEESYRIEYIKADFFLQYAVAIKIFMQLWAK